LLLSVFGHANGGPVGAKASVSSKNVILGNMVELKIRARGQSATFPAIKTIDGVKVLRQHERITNIHTYNNGKFQRERTTLVLTFAPQKDMTIPSYAVEIDGKTYKTNPIKIKVKEPITSLFSLKLEANKRSMITGEAFLVSVSFYLQHGTVITKQPEYEKPDFPGFFVEEAGDGKSYDEGNRQVTELRYILTPYAEGNLSIGPAHAKIGLQDKRKRDMVTMGVKTKWLERASNTLTIEVLSPQKMSDLVGTFSLDARIDTQKVKANKPVNLSVNIEGEGNLFNFDLLDYAPDGVTVYSDDAEVDINVTNGRIYSSYSKEFVFISDKSFIIPERTFSVYDLNTGKVKMLKVEAFTIEVEGSKALTMAANTAHTTKEKKIIQKENIFSLKYRIWLLSFILGAVFFYLLCYLPKRQSSSDKESEALKILYGHTAADPEVEEMVRKLYARKNGDQSVTIDKKRLHALIVRYG